MYLCIGIAPVPEFLSTPSSQRATPRCFAIFSAMVYFYPRPLRRGRLAPPIHTNIAAKNISIHALFAEGDQTPDTPPDMQIRISIHALFAEGDIGRIICPAHTRISIHALFAEGDS